MAFPTVTRAELRNTITSLMNNRFSKDFSTTSTLTAATNSIQVADTALANIPTGEYIDSYFFNVTLNRGSRITGFTTETGVIDLRIPIAGMQVGDEYEIIDYVSPTEIHKAIDAAMSEGFPAFYDVATDETMIIERDKRSYALAGLAKSVYGLYKVDVEYNETSKVTVGVSSTSTTVVVDPNAVITDVVAGWLVSIYSGTGTGQLRTVASVSSQEITVSAAWDTNPDTTSLIRIWNPSVQNYAWMTQQYLRIDSPIHPDNLEFLVDMDRYEGFRIRLQYAAPNTDMLTDAATTAIPKEYIKLTALATLFTAMAGRNRVDRSRYQALGDRYVQMSATYLTNHQFEQPNTSIWTMPRDYSPSGSMGVDADNPMGWNYGY